jgi:catechol 2,3-dioxygenase-like lactoylglutathione lyase family enzyme
VAIGSRDVLRVSAFYRDVFGLPEVARQHLEDGTVRSIWLSFDGGVLMFEQSSEPERRVVGVGSGPFLLAFSVSAIERESLEQRIEASGQEIEERTEFSSYARDPDGNRVAISHYPLPSGASETP